MEGVVFNRSSGLPELDQAVRRVIMMLAPYEPMPREVALDYDVIEVMRVWSIGEGLRLVYGGR